MPRLTRWLCYVAALQVVGLLGVYVKHVFMDLSLGFLVIGRSIGRPGMAALTSQEQLSFFEADFFLNFVAIPAVVSLIATQLPRLAGAVLVSFVAIALALVHFTQLMTVSAVGQFMTWDLLRDAWLWYLAHPESASENISASAVRNLIIVIAAALMPIAITVIRRNSRLFAWGRRAVACGAVALLGVSLILQAVAHEPAFDRFPQRRSALRAQLQSLSSPVGGDYVDLPIDSLARAYEDRAQAPKCANREAFFGSEAGNDVIFFIFETAPRRAFDEAMRRGWLSATQQLSQSAFVSPKHYSTYPYTSDALFSIFTGRYPSDRRNLIRSKELDLSDSLTRQLQAAGYRFHVYMPYGDIFEADKVMFEALGAATIFVPERQEIEAEMPRATAEFERSPERALIRAPQYAAHVKLRLANDLAALRRFTSDVAEMKQRKERFVAAFLPQVGHAPWVDFDGGSDITAAGAAALRIQDDWVEQLVAALRAEDQLSSTLIVVTSDHGIRTRNEDPSFSGGLLSDDSFHVPLMIHAPSAAPETRAIGSMTSHIDVSPTIRSLLGVPSNGSPAQGAPIWYDDLDRRATFFFAGQYLGADGYRLGDRYYMREVLTDTVYEASSLDFSDRRVAPPETSEERRKFLNDIWAITAAWNAASVRSPEPPMKVTNRTP